MEQMTDNETKKGDLFKDSNGATLQQSSEPEEEPRRSQRTRKLTERAQELHDTKSKKLQDRFTNTYDKWKVTAKQAKRVINGTPSSDVVQELMSKISCASADVKHSYEELRKCVLPGNEIRRRVDTCDAVSEIILKNASTYLHNKEDCDDQTKDVVWPESGSVFLSSVSNTTSKGSRSLNSASSSSMKSKQSSLSSIRRQEAAAELAATQAALKVLQKIESEQQELENLEEEDRRKMALQEEENVARKKALEEKRRQIERLQTVKKLSAAKARLQVYEQEASSDEEVAELLHNQAVERHRSSGAKRSSYEHPHQAASATALAEAIAESINVSRLPVPEPSVFTGDPLRYKDWKMSFQTLIGRKNIPVNERVYYLRKYVGGSARKAIESYFLLGTDAAYDSAWVILEERFGSSFVIAKAFKDKLASWPKIGPRDSVELRDFSDFLRGCQAAMSQIKSLEVLNTCDENQKLLTKLPDWLVASWNRKVIELEEICNNFPTFSQFVEFIKREAKIACNPVTSLHALKSGDVEKIKTTKTRNVGAKVFVSNSEESPEHKGCIFCEKQNHGIQKCWKFNEKPVQERLKFVQTKKLCFGCLQPGHHSKNCKRRSICETCKGKHPTCLHEDRERANRKEKSNDEYAENVKVSKPTKSKEKTEHNHNVELSDEATSNRVVQGMDDMYSSTVVPVWLSTSSNPENEILVYALLDNQSDTTFIMQDKADVLETKGEPVQLKLSTLSSRNTIIPSQRLVGLQVRGFYSSKKISLPVTYSREFIPANLSHIPTPKTARAWPHLEHLAEEIAPLIECDVGLLIGYNCPQALLPREVVSGKDDEPFAQKTDLGWSIVGCVSPCVDYGDAIGSSHKIIMKSVKPHSQTSKNLTTEVKYICRTQVKEFISPPDVLRMLESDFSERRVEDANLSQEDLRFLSIMEEGVKIKADGYCEMPLPFKKDRPNLPDNKVCAVHRLRCLKRRFERDKKYQNDYANFMSQIIANGDAERVPEEEINKGSVWYIPHHGVYHPHKPGKIRVVFDCSAKFEGVSLNDYLLSGPELTNSLIGVLCRFRKGQVGIMCDIERMFHQFHVKTEDQDYLRFLWWDDGNIQAQPSIYRMRVHLFGAVSSPGCANFGLKHVAAQGQGQYSETTIQFIERNFYVDDGLTSVATKDEAIRLVKEARQLCSSGNLRLHKFVSNNQDVLASIPEDDCADSVRNRDMTLGESHIERALGIKWCVVSDQFHFRVIVDERPLSRRGVLSTVASIYDPLGFVAPFILVGKQILQEMCREKIGWDEPLSEDLRPRWESWLLDLKNLSDIKIQRCYLPKDFKEVERYELHHFSDASVKGYGECSYLRAISISNQVYCSLVIGKARVTPTKVTTVPRLELSAAVIAVRTSNLLKKELDVQAQEFFWTDSKVVLGYINNDARRFHIFVANRIQRIQEGSNPDQWRYVTSEDNPADHSSRGLTVKGLVTSNWFTGPDFLWHNELPANTVKVGELEAENPELRKTFVHKTLTTEESLLSRFLRFSKWTRLVKAIARLIRCVKEVKGSLSRTNKVTSLEERKEAEFFIIATVQRAVFSEEIQDLSSKREITKNSAKRLHKLNPFLDEKGVLRVGGRLERSSLHTYIKHPAILPSKTHISQLLIDHFHQRVHHQGRGMTMNELRSNGIWILGCSHAVSSYIYKCVKCRKFRRNTEIQRMADLPCERVEASPPFTYCGVDCFGPFYIKEGRKELKRYGLLFTCLCSRAVHIELLDDMTSDAFINSLRTLIAIRGNVRQLWSDQGTNFVGARREFLESVKEMDQENLKQLGCEFVMNPPSASHMGGAWERQIRTIRSVLTSILDHSSKRLDISSLRTYLYEVMAIINSRPLTTHLLSDPSAPQPLTPNHILTMKSSVVLPPPGEFVKEDLYLRKRWRKVQYLANEFWTRWKREYLLNLQQRNKWYKTQRNAKINDIVILMDNSLPRNEWRLAKVTKVFPSEDGVIRKLELLMSDATLDDQGKRVNKPVYLERPIHKTVTLVEAE
ncbi:uncharacterized protein LOC111611627 [Xiphophorus maculatus]|uniref:uncharacterized protein LOC111611627 n=1 Tax=Xiphophorus maculatus TaxID=8083 RepID=UPI000C6E4F36|nr:uncharacterized protein LOC111611627 [Xiphophorus maculatus]XP_023204624.1 uncharacterized protein LOC111611627 [Xiphophorus maculatus]